MTTTPEQRDYFFAIEQPDQEVHLWAEGAGVETLRAMARQTLFGAALEGKALHGNSELGRFVTEGLYNRYAREVSIFDADTCAVVSLDWDSVQEVFNELFRRTNSNYAREEVCFTAVRQGLRSPQSVIEEFRQHIRDCSLIERAGYSWFSEQGYQLLGPAHRKSEADKRWIGKPLILETIPRRKAKDPKEQGARDALFDLIPAKTIGKAGRVAIFNTRKDGSIHRKNPFNGQKLPVDTVYGYVEDRQFVPMYNRTTQTVIEQHSE